MSRIGQVAVVGVGRKSTQSTLVGWRLTDGVKYLHVANVVDVKGFLQAHNQPLEKRRAQSFGARKTSVDPLIVDLNPNNRFHQ